MTAPRCWGIYRELAHSPGRESDDALILRAAGEHLSRLGFEVSLLTPDEAAAAGDREVPPFVFVMCERLAILDRLRRWEERGTLVLNSTEGILNTYRHRTIERFASDSVPFPRSVLVSTGGASAGPLPCWVKRADVHQTQAGDVTYAEDADGVAASLRALAGRGIGQAVLQEHVPGDLIKFYGVGDGEDGAPPWFTWFYHRDQQLAGHAFDEAELAGAARAGAGSLGLTVYGGDAIVGPGGRPVLIDLNAWPSFALFRPVAGERIAEHLAARFRKHAGLGVVTA